MATHSSVLAWRIPGMGEPGGLPSMGSHRVGHNWSNLAAVAARGNKFQSKTYHANSPATQEHSPKLQYTGCPKSHQTHRHLKTHGWILDCTPERRNPAPPTRIPTQASLTRKPWQATHPTPSTVRNLHNKEEPQTARIQKGHLKHSNINKIKRQRKTQQVKKQDKCPPNQQKRKR